MISRTENTELLPKIAPKQWPIFYTMDIKPCITPGQHETSLFSPAGRLHKMWAEHEGGTSGDMSDANETKTRVLQVTILYFRVYKVTHLQGLRKRGDPKLFERRPEYLLPPPPINNLVENALTFETESI